MDYSPAAIADAIAFTPGAPVRTANGRAGTVLRRAPASDEGPQVVIAWLQRKSDDDTETLPLCALALDHKRLTEARESLADTGGAFSAIFGALAALDELYEASAEAEYTDTDAVWTTVDVVRTLLRRVLPVLQVVRLATAAGDLSYQAAEHDVAQGTADALTAVLA